MENAPPSVHDRHIIAYTVHGRDRTITLRTEHPYTDPSQIIDVLFEGVLAYYFEHDLMGNIIFDIEEVDLPQLVRTQNTLFEAGWKWGWPVGWEHQKESMEAYAMRLEMKAFELTSSYGMTGWVLGRSMTKILKN